VIAIDWVVLEDSRGNQLDQVKFDAAFQLDLVSLIVEVFVVGAAVDRVGRHHRVCLDYLRR